MEKTSCGVEELGPLVVAAQALQPVGQEWVVGLEEPLVEELGYSLAVGWETGS